jgi:CBS domain-containing membrane protein
MKKRTPVSKIMTKDPITVNLSNAVADVVQIFKDHNIHHIPVVSGDKLIGMISKTDIDRISFVNSYAMEAASAMVYDILKLEQVMTANLETVQVEDQIKEAAELLARGRYHALPVMDGKKLAGIVTSTDVINYLLEQY